MNKVIVISDCLQLNHSFWIRIGQFLDTELMQKEITITDTCKYIENTQKGIDYLVERGEDPQKLQSAISWLQSNHNYDKIKFDRFVNYNKSLDRIRNTDFVYLYPEYCNDV